MTHARPQGYVGLIVGGPADGQMHSDLLPSFEIPEARIPSLALFDKARADVAGLPAPATITYFRYKFAPVYSDSGETLGMWIPQEWTPSQAFDRLYSIYINWRRRIEEG